MRGENLPALLGDILPAHRIEILVLLVVVRILPLLSLIFLNIQFRLLFDTGFMSVEADDNVLAVGEILPWMTATTSKAFKLAGRTSYLSGIVTVPL
jgi:hypothetical protein